RSEDAGVRRDGAIVVPRRRSRVAAPDRRPLRSRVACPRQLGAGADAAAAIRRRDPGGAAEERGGGRRRERPQGGADGGADPGAQAVTTERTEKHGAHPFFVITSTDERHSLKDVGQGGAM